MSKFFNSLGAPFRLAVFLLACLAVAGRAPAADRAVWELRPYQIRVVFAPDSSPLWTARRLETLQASLRDAARAMVGRPWRLETAAAEAADSRRLHAADESEWEAAARPLLARATTGAAAPDDKVIVLSLRGAAAGASLSAREWDVDTAGWGPPIIRFAADRHELSAACFAAVAAAFSPQARCETIEGDRLTVRLRAGNLSPRDSRFAPLRPGDVVRLARRGVGGRGRRLDDTFLVVEKNDGREAICLAHSRYAEPLSAIAASPADWLALGVGSPGRSTQLRLSDASGAPLVGCRVFSDALGAGEALPLGGTNSQGELAIPVADSPLRVLSLRIGDEVVAKLPLVPGWTADRELTLDLDGSRLTAEQATASLRLRLLEEVVRCEALLAQARRKAAAGDAEGARGLLDAAAAAQQAARAALEAAAKPLRPAAADAAADRLWHGLDQAIAERLASARVDGVRNELFPPPAAPPPAETTPAEAAPADATSDAPAPAAGS